MYTKIKLTPSKYAIIERIAKQRGITCNDAIRDALDHITDIPPLHTPRGNTFKHISLSIPLKTWKKWKSNNKHITMPQSPEEIDRFVTCIVESCI